LTFSGRHNNSKEKLQMNIPAKRWTKKYPPKKILAIRLQAMGDVVVTLPYLLDLRKSLGSSTELDFLTREEVESIPNNVVLFDRVFAIGGGRNFKKQLLCTAFLLPGLLSKRYDVIIDLQNNLISKIIRKILHPKAWSVYDKVSPVSGAVRYRLTIDAIGITKNKACVNLKLKNPASGLNILKNNGWQDEDELVVLNPAGFFETRNWNIGNYAAFADLWLKQFPKTKFVVMGISLIAEKAVFLQEYLGNKLINLVGQTTPLEAFAILQRVKFMLSEDSGLLHMGWISGIPTLALFGSTRSDWSRPIGEHTFLLNSSDLPCGNCMQAVCRFGDVHCLSRYGPEQVFHHALNLIEKYNKRVKR
jgi:heptosyltransferase-2